MPEVKLVMRYNEETEEVETLIDDEVLISSGKDEFISWVNYYTEQNPPPVKEEPVAPMPEAEEISSTEEVDKPSETVVE